MPTRLSDNQPALTLPILLLFFGFFFPRLVVVLLYLFTDWWSSAFDSILWPILGFFFMPLTVLWFGISETYFSDSVQTIGLVIAVLMDLGIIGRGSKKRQD